MTDDPLNLCVTDEIASEIIRGMSDGVLVLDRNGMIVSVNPAALEMLRRQGSDVQGRPFRDVFKGDSANEEFSIAVMDCLNRSQPFENQEVRVFKPEGGSVDLAMKVSPLVSSREHGQAIIFVFRDVTEIKSLDRARQRVLNHLSHELKTPLAIIKGSIRHLDVDLSGPVMERVDRNLRRLEEIQSEVDDIIRHGEAREDYPFRRWLDQVLDLADLLVADVPTCGDSLRDLRSTIEGMFVEKTLPGKSAARLGDCATKVLNAARQQSLHRKIVYVVRMDGNPLVRVGADLLEKVLMAPLKNAIENTPDGGKISLALQTVGAKAIWVVKDSGVGITEESQRQIFSGFYHARETDLYSTKRPFDFQAGGKGLDLLRLRILSKAYGFKIEWESRRCRHLPVEKILCPGSTVACPHISEAGECEESGGTMVRLTFDVFEDSQHG